MRRLSPFLISAALLGSVACAGVPDTSPTTPTGGAGSPQLSPPISSPYCTAKTSGEIVTEINNLFFKNDWPDANSALGKFNNVQSLIDAGNVTGAQMATRDLVGFVKNKFQHLTATQQAASLADYNQLVSDLYCFVGISGLVFDLNPGDPEKAFDIPGVGGVDFPANSVPVGTLVALTNLNGSPCPLLTSLDCYTGFLSISLFPAATLPQAATVVLCPPLGAPSTLAVGHQNTATGFELLTPTAVPTLLSATCGSSSGQNRAPSSWLARMLDQAVEALLPKRLEAAVFRGAGGFGGLTTSFSPFGLIDLSLSATGGLGGTTSGFAPQAGPSAAPSGPMFANPPVPANAIQGPAGTSTTTGLPAVTIATPGGDADGVNKVAGVTVTFRTSAATLYDPDSQATVCRVVSGTPVAQDTVQVVTDINGVATLPCLMYGTLAGFANLSATFDPTTLNFPNSNLVTITANDGSAGGTSLNWLVQTVAGPASVIQTYIGNVAAPTYNYGSSTAYTNVTPAPKVIVKDAYGNLVGGAPVFWNATTSNGGVLTVGAAGTPTDASGVATVSSWTIGEGLNEATAGLSAIASSGDALFTASTPTGLSVFACAVGTAGSKTDVMPFSIKTPNASVRSVTLYMSVNGQASALTSYPATLDVYYGTAAGGAKIGSGTGLVQLPGNNGNALPVTFVLSDPVTQTESRGSGDLLFKLTVTAPATRKPQLWYLNATFKNNDPCFSSLIYTSYPSLTTFKRGLSINATN